LEFEDLDWMLGLFASPFWCWIMDETYLVLKAE